MVTDDSQSHAGIQPMTRKSAHAMTIHALSHILESIYPARYALPDDNAGLQLGRPETGVTGVMVALDPEIPALDAAAAEDANVLVTHHPLWMKPPRKLAPDLPVARIVDHACRLKIAVIAAHTNADFAPQGLCHVLADTLHLIRQKPLKVAHGIPIGRIGRLARPSPAVIWRRSLAARFGSELRWSGIEPRKISTVALCTGSGSDLIADAFAAGADAFVTGDLKYHSARDTEELARIRRERLGPSAGFLLVDAGHHGTERHFVRTAATALRHAAPGLRVGEYESVSPFHPAGV